MINIEVFIMVTTIIMIMMPKIIKIFMPIMIYDYDNDYDKQNYNDN